MYKYLIILVLVHSALAVTEPDNEKTLEDIINEIFGEPPDSYSPIPEGGQASSCSQVEGRGVGCYECRFCNDTFVANMRYQSNKLEIFVNNAQCTTPVKLCCTAQSDLLNFRSDNKCGKPNPEGIPRRRRQSLRSILQGEFPWRAWIYSKNSDNPLCAAMYVNEDKKALLTLASCVHAHAHAPDALEVAFMSGSLRAQVGQVVVHEGYRPGEDTHNIAIVYLNSLERTPLWAYPVCLPQAAPLITPCIVATASNLRINTVIPVRSACTLDNSTLPESLTCSLAPPGDYEPETAAGVYCLDEQNMPPCYTLHGIFTSEIQNIATYVSVWHFMPWIKSQMNLTDV